MTLTGNKSLCRRDDNFIPRIRFAIRYKFANFAAYMGGPPAHGPYHGLVKQPTNLIKNERDRNRLGQPHLQLHAYRL